MADDREVREPPPLFGDDDDAVEIDQDNDDLFASASEVIVYNHRTTGSVTMTLTHDD